MVMSFKPFLNRNSKDWNNSKENERKVLKLQAIIMKENVQNLLPAVEKKKQTNKSQIAYKYEAAVR